MKADFEKGTKVCSRCKKELPLNSFSINKSTNDNLCCYCKQCAKECAKQYRDNNKDKTKSYKKSYNDKKYNTFGRIGRVRGKGVIIKRDYELTKEQLRRREVNRRVRRHKRKRIDVQGILIWYDESLNELDLKSYKRMLVREYQRQKYCAIRGYVGRVQPSEHFLFDFDLEQMLKDNVYYKVGKNKRTYMERWWKGNIRHWTVKDGIWKE